MRMETGTFLDGGIQDFISKYFVPLKYESGKDGEQFMRFDVRGTPTFVVLDSEGNESPRHSSAVVRAPLSAFGRPRLCPHGCRRLRCCGSCWCGSIRADGRCNRG